MIKAMRTFFLLSVVLLIRSYGQQSDPGLLTMDRIFGSMEFMGERVGQLHWHEDGKYYIKTEPSETVKGSQNLIRYTTASGKSTVLVKAEDLIPAGQDKALTMESFSFSDDNKKMLVFTNSQRVWRQNTRGDYWLLELSTKKLSKLGGNGPVSSMMFATFSPDGRKIAFVRGNNLYVEDLTSGEITSLTSDGSETIINGTFDWVYEEELDLRHGFRWSPDSKSIAFWQLDASGIGVFYMMNMTDSLYSYTIPVQYPKAGTTNSAAKIGCVYLSTGKITWMQLPGDPRQHYPARMEWADNSEELLIQQLNRLQNTNRVFLAKAADGTVNNIFTDQDSAWVETNDKITWLENGRYFTWLSERSGWKHLLRVSRDGGELTELTKGEFDLMDLMTVDEKNGWIYFTASPENATRRYLYKIRLDGQGQAQRLTPANQSGTHSYRFSPNGKYAIHSWSSIDLPGPTELIALPDHKPIRTLAENKALIDKLNSLNRMPTEFIKIPLETGQYLDAWVMKPWPFDPAKKYPVLFYVYGEAAGTTVNDAWRGSQHLWHTLFTQQGYIVMSVDNRGTPAPKGRDWRKVIYGDIGTIASADQAAAVQYARTWDFVDSTRIAIWGWSGGGSSSLNAIFRYPELYQTAMAVAAVSDQRLYDTIYQERYLGLPQDNAEGYKKSSPITYAGNLKGNLLLVHGTNDDNVHYQNVENLINELVNHNKMFTVVPYPNRSHGIYEGGRNTRRHVFEVLTWYLHTHCPAGGR